VTDKQNVVISVSECNHCWAKWCIPVIPATWEAAIGGWKFKASKGKNVSETLFQKQVRSGGAACGPTYLGSRGRRMVGLGKVNLRRYVKSKLK
jgi:hypothetical protein